MNYKEGILMPGFIFILISIPFLILNYFYTDIIIGILLCFIGLFMTIIGGIIGACDIIEKRILLKREEKKIEIRERNDKMKKMKVFIESL